MQQNNSYYDQCFLEMKEMFNLPDEMFFELHDAFFEIASHQIDLLRTALLQKNLEQLILHSHTLKGSAASLRHMSISRMASEIEKNAKEKNPFDYATGIFSIYEEITKLRSLYMNWKPNKLKSLE